MNSFDFSDDRMVLAGTLYGEARGCGRAGMEDVAQCVLNRRAERWAATAAGVCLARLQFSCWNSGDPNRTRILAAPDGHDAAWALALVVAESALAGANPDRIDGADSYFARSMPRAPYWAAAPADFRARDPWHDFWAVRGQAPHFAPVLSTHSSVTADQLNQMQLDRIAGAG